MKTAAAFYAPQTTQQAWDNHFSAFGAQDVPKILLDYESASVVSVYDYCGGTQVDYAGVPAIEGLFTQLFVDLTAEPTLTVPVEDVYEDGVFLVWTAAPQGFTQVTDSFIFDPTSNRILQQNIVIYSDTCPEPTRRELQTVNGSWDNHFAAFGAQDLAKIMEDYTEASVVALYNFEGDGAQTATYFEGLSAIEGLFEGLFADLDQNLDTLGAPVVDTTATPVENTFLVWTCPSCSSEKPGAYSYVTDTFVYGTPNAQNGPAITRQNIVVFDTYAPQTTQQALLLSLASANNATDVTASSCGCSNDCISACRVEGFCCASGGGPTTPICYCSFSPGCCRTGGEDFNILMEGDN